MRKPNGVTGTWVKVCGITRPVDVEAAIQAGADAIGLALLARSPRCVDLPRAAELARAAAGRVEVFALVDGAAADAVSAARLVGADSVQPYGPQAGTIAAQAIGAGMGVLFPVPVTAGSGIDISSVPPGARPLLDTAVSGRTGGTGQSFAWERARGVVDAVIAGGLNPDNVHDAIEAAQPWGVDASSGLEATVGVKDHVKVTSFVRAAKLQSAAPKVKDP